jgi:hypothetical protein
VDDHEPLNLRHSVLLALTQDPQPVSDIAAKAGLPETETRDALEQLTAESIAIAEDDGYELTGPLSWFGGFAAAAKYHAKKKFVVTVPGDLESHLYVDDIRIKGRVPAGDPANETAAVFACGRVAREVLPPSGQNMPTCTECLRVMGEYGSGGPHGLQNR